MEQEIINFSILKYKGVTRIVNKSDSNCIISLVPEKPKRTYVDIFVVKQNTCLILEDDLPIEKISIRFKP